MGIYANVYCCKCKVECITYYVWHVKRVNFNVIPLCQCRFTDEKKDIYSRMLGSTWTGLENSRMSYQHQLIDHVTLQSYCSGLLEVGRQGQHIFLRFVQKHFRPMHVLYDPIDGRSTPRELPTALLCMTCSHAQLPSWVKSSLGAL